MDYEISRLGPTRSDRQIPINATNAHTKCHTSDIFSAENGSWIMEYPC